MKGQNMDLMLHGNTWFQKQLFRGYYEIHALENR